MTRACIIASALLLAGTAARCNAADDTVFRDGFDRWAPVLLYTDIVSGPTSGGEGGKGAYLSLFGRNFGNGVAGTNLKVYIGNSEVAGYRTFGASRGRADIQQVTVQLGALGNQGAGTPLPIRVVVDGAPSNTDHAFTINPGRMIFVDPQNGNDATAVVGDIGHPYKHVQNASDFGASAWGQVRAGDFLVLRGGTYTDVGYEQYFLRFMIRVGGVPDRSSGSAPTGTTGTGPITVLGYPGETAYIDADAATHPGGGLSGLNGENYPLAGKWIVIANLKVEGGGYDGPISQQIHGDNWRIVNNELVAYTGVTSGPSPSRMGGITGNGANSVWLGNHIHDIQGSTNEAHGIYVDGDGSYDIGYNDIHDIHSGKGIQLFANGGNGSDVINHVRIHHNSVRRVTQYGINIADGSQDDIAIWNNLVTDAASGGLRFNTNTLHGCRIYNNTFYANNTVGSEIYGVLMNDWGFPSDALDLRNNIVWARSGTAYTGGSVGFDGAIGTITRNLWHGGNDGHAFDADPLDGDPQLVAPGTDFHIGNAASIAVDSGDPAAATLVRDDYDAARPRPQGSAIDIGAWEL